MSQAHVVGPACSVCGGTARYRSRGCVTCSIARSVEWKRRNKEKVRASSKRYNKANPERVLANHRKKYPAPTRPEPEHCEMCGRKPFKRLNLDHCHTSGVFRGWLCWDCNVALGKLGDDISLAVGLLQHYLGVVNGTN